jgi:ribosomal protein L32
LDRRRKKLHPWALEAASMQEKVATKHTRCNARICSCNSGISTIDGGGKKKKGDVANYGDLIGYVPFLRGGRGSAAGRPAWRQVKGHGGI